MKKCIQCGNELNDNAQFCPGCGTKQPEKEQSLFCEKCGAKLSPDSRFCPSCGADRTGNQQSNTYTGYQPNYGGWTSSRQANAPAVIVELSKRMKTTAIMGIVLASLQAVVVIISLIGIIGASYFMDTTSLWIDTIVLAALSALNFVGSFKSMSFSREIYTRPVGIGKKYIPVGGFVGPIIWNSVLFIINIAFLSIFGIIVMGYAVTVSILDIAYVRGFVIQNQAELERLEQQHI